MLNRMAMPLVLAAGGALFSMSAQADARPPVVADADSRPVHVITAARTLAGSALHGINGVAVHDSLGTSLTLLQLEPAQLHELTAHVHETEGRCGGYFAFDSRDQAEAFLLSDQSLKAVSAPAAITYTIDNGDTVLPWLPEVTAGNIHATMAHLSSYQNRYYASVHGKAAAEWIRDTWLALGNGRTDVHAELFIGCTNCSMQPSVILTVDGVELPDEVVVVGAHLDSIRSGAGGNVEQFAPGADDDASGIATITEVIRIALASGWQPKRTVKFMGYAAEEVGLRGSAAIAAKFQSDGVNVIGALQLDMTNYRNGVAFDLKFISDYSNGPLQAFAASLFDAYLMPLGLVRSSHACGYGCSDHASWTARGYPAVMAAEAGGVGEPFFNRLHSANDTLANMGNSADNSAKFARFGLAFIGETAKTAMSDRIFASGFDG